MKARMSPMTVAETGNELRMGREIDAATSKSPQQPRHLRDTDRWTVLPIRAEGKQAGCPRSSTCKL